MPVLGPSSSGPVISNGGSPGHGCRPGFGPRADVLPVSAAPRPRRRMSKSSAPAAGLSGTRNFGQNALWDGLFENGVGAEDDLHLGTRRPDPDDESTVIHAITCPNPLQPTGASCASTPGSPLHALGH